MKITIGKDTYTVTEFGSNSVTFSGPGGTLLSGFVGVDEFTGEKVLRCTQPDNKRTRHTLNNLPGRFDYAGVALILISMLAAPDSLGARMVSYWPVSYLTYQYING